MKPTPVQSSILYSIFLLFVCSLFFVLCSLFFVLCSLFFVFVFVFVFLFCFLFYFEVKQDMLLGEQMLVRSQTGTGKTIAVVAGILHQLRSFCTEEERRGETSRKKYIQTAKANNKHNATRKQVQETTRRSMKVLVMVPTRELAWQVSISIVFFYF